METDNNNQEPPVITQSKERIIIDKLLEDIDREVSAALNHQRQLAKEIEIANAESKIAGEYRVKFMDLRDRLTRLIKELSK